MTKEYEAIVNTYGRTRANRSGLLYMRHIEVGLGLLEYLGKSTYAGRDYGAESALGRAWCVHPLYQLDEFFGKIAHGEMPHPTDDPYVVLLAMEYRRVANSFLTNWEEIPAQRADPGPVPCHVEAVDVLLTVDKVHNWYDARKYLYPRIEFDEQRKLDIYFSTWLRALQVSPILQRRLEQVIAERD